MRLRNLEQDLSEARLSADEARRLRVGDFEFAFIPKSNGEGCDRVRQFIERHEWLGKMPTRPTHRFIAIYKGRIAGAVVMATPNAFSHLLGRENRHLEKLISRGACISWSPKNLASALVMFAVRWMVKNTGFRVFTAYSDTEARELGTIYQACNFIYLGQKSGALFECFDPLDPKRGWFSDRLFRKHSQIKKYARELGIEWQTSWSSHDKTLWGQMPDEIRQQLAEHARAHQVRCLRRPIPRKHKYAYILGRSSAETKKLKALFANLNPDLVGLPYPKIRGPEDNTADKIQTSKEENLTTSRAEVRPQIVNENFEYLTVKEAARMLGVSVWTIYKLIESDETFPSHNIGAKKKFVIERAKLPEWIEATSKRRARNRMRLPSGSELLKIGES